jgi:hypothetical protein
MELQREWIEERQAFERGAGKYWLREVAGATGRLIPLLSREHADRGVNRYRPSGPLNSNSIAHRLTVYPSREPGDSRNLYKSLYF